MNCTLHNITINGKPSLLYEGMVDQFGDEVAYSRYQELFRESFMEDFGRWDIYSKIISKSPLSLYEQQVFEADFGNDSNLISKVFEGYTNELGEPIITETGFRDLEILNEYRSDLIKNLNVDYAKVTPDTFTKFDRITRPIITEDLSLEQLYLLNQLSEDDKVKYMGYLSLDNIEKELSNTETIKELRSRGYSLKQVLTNQNIAEGLINTPATTSKHSSLIAEVRSLLKNEYKYSTNQLINVLEDIENISLSIPKIPGYLSKVSKKINPDLFYNYLVETLPNELLEAHRQLINSGKFKIIC